MHGSRRTWVSCWGQANMMFLEKKETNKAGKMRWRMKGTEQKSKRGRSKYKPRKGRKIARRNTSSHVTRNSAVSMQRLCSALWLTHFPGSLLAALAGSTLNGTSIPYRQAYRSPGVRDLSQCCSHSTTGAKLHKRVDADSGLFLHRRRCDAGIMLSLAPSISEHRTFQCHWIWTRTDCHMWTDCDENL
jgi:hypothetical protein